MRRKCCRVGRGFQVLDSSYQSGQTVGAKLRLARLARKYTQYQLAQPDFSVSYISAIERDQIQPSLRALEILARRLDLNATDLLPESDEALHEVSPAKHMAGKEKEQDLLFLEACIALYQGKPEQTISLLRTLLAQSGEEHMDGVEGIVYSLLLGRAYLAKGLLYESEPLLAKAARLGSVLDDPLYPFILSVQNSLYRVMRNIEQALQSHQESLTYLEQRSPSSLHDFFLPQLYVSLGLYYSHPGAIQQAHLMFARALELLSTRYSSSTQVAACLDLARFYSEREEYWLAALHHYRALMVEFQVRLPALRSEIHQALGKVLLKSRPEEVCAHLLNVLQEARARHDSLTQASASIQLANWFFTCGERAKAAVYAHEAQELAEPFGETLIQTDILFLLGELAYQREEYPASDHYFESGLAMLEHLGQKGELVEHLTRYAHLLEERGLIEKALTYWKRAYENRRTN